MKRAALPISTFSLMFVLSAATAQNSSSAGGGARNAINGINSYPGPEFVRYEPEREALDRRIDLFLNDWQGSMPRHEHGSLVLRDILTRGDNFAPSEKGAVLHYGNFLAYGRLSPWNSTLPSRLERQQEVFYILGGEGEITAGSDTAALRKDIAVFMPANLEFVMRSTSAEPLVMYVINEPTPADFHPKTKMAVKDESAGHQRTPAGGDPYVVPGASGHWGHIVRELFSPADGLATEQSVITVTLNPLTMGEPHPHRPGQEEIWAAIDGDSLAFLGTEIRIQRPGMAYMLPPDATTIHSNVNASDRPAKFLYFAKFSDGDNWRHGAPAATR